MLNIYITNLRKYNEGELLGEWLELPATEDEIKEALENIGIDENYEEYFITDYVSNFGLEVDQWEGIEELNEIAEKMNDLDCEQLEVFKIIVREHTNDTQEAFDIVEEGRYRIWTGCEDMTDVAIQAVEESGMLDNVDSNLSRYFDYKAYGRDLQIEGHFFFTNDGDCVEIY